MWNLTTNVLAQLPSIERSGGGGCLRSAQLLIEYTVPEDNQVRPSQLPVTPTTEDPNPHQAPKDTECKAHVCTQTYTYTYYLRIKFF